jgi:hypothetical protein
MRVNKSYFMTYQIPYHTTESGLTMKKKKTPKPNEEKCHRCGMKRHWLCTYRTAKHMVDLYQTPIKGNQN